MCLCGLRFNKHIIFHILYIIVAPLCLAFNTSIFIKSSSFWEVRHALIGQLSGALWLAEYLKRVTELLRPSPYCDAVSRRNETKTMKPIIKGIVHFEIKIWYVSAYPKGIQDVGVFFSSVDPILMFLGQTVLVCQSYNGRYRSLSL